MVMIMVMSGSERPAQTTSWYENSGIDGEDGDNDNDDHDDGDPDGDGGDGAWRDNGFVPFTSPQLVLAEG